MNSELFFFYKRFVVCILKYKRNLPKQTKLNQPKKDKEKKISRKNLKKVERLHKYQKCIVANNIRNGLISNYCFPVVTLFMFGRQPSILFREQDESLQQTPPAMNQMYHCPSKSRISTGLKILLIMPFSELIVEVCHSILILAMIYCLNIFLVDILAHASWLRNMADADWLVPFSC